MSHEFHGPLTIDLKIAVTDGKGLDAVITWSMPPGRHPTSAEIEAAQVEALKQAPDGFRLMTKREWWAALCEERFGGRYAMPGSDEWDKP